jgi:hypothetical protein
MPCDDRSPEEIGVWSEADQAGLLSIAQTKALWLWMMDPGVKGWQQLCIIDKGGTDRRALSAALSIADVMRIPRSSIVLQGDEEQEEDISNLEPENAWIYDCVKRGRFHLVG